MIKKVNLASNNVFLAVVRFVIQGAFSTIAQSKEIKRKIRKNSSLVSFHVIWLRNLRINMVLKFVLTNFLLYYRYSKERFYYGRKEG